MPVAIRRMGRMGKVNPGLHHIAGSDVTPKMQRQYEDILASLREAHRYRTDADRKRVAAATVRKLANPTPLEEATRIAEEFHGRMALGDFEVTEHEIYSDTGGVIGYLSQLGIADPASVNNKIPISWPYDPDNPEDNILVIAPDKYNIEYVGGDQDFDWQNVDGASTSELKNLIFVGPVVEIDYWADKHHLTGPKQQKEGMIYYHNFGEKGGELPYLIFDSRNKKLMFVGGDYIITPEGIDG